MRDCELAFFLSSFSNQAFRCAFSPLSDKKDLLEFERVKVVRGGREYDGISLQKIRYEAELQQAFETQWRMAAEAGAHLFFAPEMLCTDMLAEEINGYNTVVRRLSRDMRKTGLPVPFLTIMPSHSRSGTNTVTILDQNGRVIGRQRKLYPFRDVHMHAIEALTESPQHEIILIHLPGVHRIAILPCADLLTESPDYAHKIICGKLGATLIITPSYSGGEQDFTDGRRIAADSGSGRCKGDQLYSHASASSGAKDATSSKRSF